MSETALDLCEQLIVGRDNDCSLGPMRMQGNVKYVFEQVSIKRYALLHI